MTDHPITPPPELFEQWQFMTPSLALKAAYRAGADQELEACCEWVEREIGHGREWGAELRAARRPPAVPETIEVDGYTYRLVK